MTANVEIPNKDFWDELMRHARKMPELPILNLKKESIEYQITDVRYLDKTAVGWFNQVLNRIIYNDELESQKFDLAEDINDDGLQVFTDILLQIGVTAIKENEDYISTSIVTGFKRNENAITVELNKKDAEIIHDLAKDKDEIQFFELFVELGDKLLKEE